MAGNSSVTGQETITFTDNMSFDGTQRGGAMTTNGQLWIGCTSGRHVRLGTLTSPDGSVNIGYSFPNITLQTTPITFPISLANGGTGASLTASNGGIFYSTATAGAILPGTATANQALLSGASSAPAWSTATYPATTTINRLLYSSANNTITDLATANSGVLITSAGGVPSISSTLPSAVQGNITSLGTIASGVWNGTVIGLAYGGTNNNLTASNGGIFYSTATAAAILAGTVTANQMLLSGASTTPAWSTATHPATTTLGDLIYASAANVYSNLSISSLAGSNLIFDGTNVAWFHPKLHTYFFDDFMPVSFVSTTRIFAAVAVNSGNFLSNAANYADSGHPGVFGLLTGTQTNGGAYLDTANSTSTQPLVLGGGQITLEWCVKMDTLSDGTNTYNVNVGLMETFSNTNPTAGVYFSYSDAGGGGTQPNWFIATATGSVTSLTSSGVAATNTFTRLKIVINAAGTSATYYINDVSVGTKSGSFPTGYLGIGASMLKSAGGTQRILYVDYCYFFQVFTSSR